MESSAGMVTAAQEPKFLEDKPRQRGRPTKFTRDVANRACYLASLGLTDEQVCTGLGLSVQTLNGWKRSRVFFEQLQAAKAKADRWVVRSLFRLAIGGWRRRRKVIRHSSGKEIIEEGVEQVSPNFLAIKFWLINRLPHKWRDPTDKTPFVPAVQQYVPMEGDAVEDRPPWVSPLEIEKNNGE